MSLDNPASKATLKHPAKDFGVLPSLGFIVFFTSVILVAVIPLLNFTYHYLNGFILHENEYYLSGIRTTITLWLMGDVIINGRSRWGMSKRKKFVKKNLIPFLNKKYNINIDKSTATMLMVEQPFVLEKDIFVQFDGWNYIESDAAHQHSKKDGIDISNFLTLITENGKEFGTPKDSNVLKGNTADDKFIIGEGNSFYEPHIVKLAVMHLIDNLPEDSAAEFTVIERKATFSDISASLFIENKQGNFKYSPKDLNTFVEAISVNVETNGSALITAAVSDVNDEIQFNGVVFYRKEFDFIENETMQKMFNSTKSNLNYNHNYNWVEYISRKK